MSAQVAALKELLERRFPGAVPLERRTTGGIATGFEALDRALPGGGLPRGQMVAWAPGGGANAVLRSACRRVVEGGERAAWVDGAGVVTGDFWGNDAALFRPGEPVEVLECAEELARCGGFALVVVTGARTRDAERVRLSRAAREGGGSLVMLEGGGFMGAVRVATRIGAGGWLWRLDPFGEPAEVEEVVVRARVTASGWSEEAEFRLPVVMHEVRMSVESRLADRRGAAR